MSYTPLPSIEMPHWPPAYWQDLPEDESPLDRTLRLLEGLANPHLQLPPVIHVAGTNGKGSTIAFLRAMLEAAGMKVHAYTSPHLRRFEERITVASNPVDPAKLHQALEACRYANEEQPIGFFEGTTAAAFLLFNQAPADVLLLETGMGGEFDPTNVLPAVRLSIITTISADHQEYLGDTLTEIAEHKAGIMKPECPVIIGFQAPEVMEMLEKIAESKGCPALVYGKHWAVQKSSKGMIYADAYGQVDLPLPALKGPHQLVNAGCAIAALSVIEEFEISADPIIAGLKWVQWLGRLEHVTSDVVDLPANLECWFDGGHNAAAGHMLSVVAEEEWNDGKPLYIIFGTTRGKDAAAMLAPLTPFAEEIIAVPVLAEPKCFTPLEIADQCENAGFEIRIEDSVAAAIESIRFTHDASTSVRILVFGSLYLRLELVE